APSISDRGSGGGTRVLGSRVPPGGGRTRRSHMDPNLNACLEMIFRWIHVVAGIAWIGHLYFFNFVNSQVVKTYDADSKRKVVPELMPRALYWFRWGAAYTWVTGFLLAGMVYYNSDQLVTEADKKGMAIGVSLLLIAIIFFIYD